ITNVRTMFAKDPLRSGPVDINKVIATVLDLFRIERQKYSIDASAQLADGLPPVTGIETQLQQVIMNLFMNAVESMQQVTDRPRTLRVSTEPGDKVVKISVEDSGVGIDRGNIGQVFKPMFTTKSRGTGMGLAICQSIIETHKGRIWVTPGSKHGT